MIIHVIIDMYILMKNIDSDNLVPSKLVNPYGVILVKFGKITPYITIAMWPMSFDYILIPNGL